MSEGSLSAEENKAIVGRYWLEVVTQNNLEVIDEIFAPNYALCDYSLCGKKGPHSRDDVKRVLVNFRERYPDLRAGIEEQVVEGDTVVTRYTTFGTHIDTDEEIEVGGTNISRLRHGMVWQAWNYWDAVVLVDHEDPERTHWCWWCR